MTKKELQEVKKRLMGWKNAKIVKDHWSGQWYLTAKDIFSGKWMIYDPRDGYFK